MFEYNLKLARLSIQRSPVLSVLIIAAIGLGTGVFMILLTAYHLLDRNPLPQKSSVVYRVLMDAWDPDSEPSQGIWEPGEPPYLMTYTDAIALMKSDIPTYQAAMFSSAMYLRDPDSSSDAKKPFRVTTRVTFGNFFPMFDVPFQYGGGWNDTADEQPQPVAVISQRLNEKVFGGEDSVGRSILLNNADFRVIGVLDAWHPLPMFYNIMSLGFGVGPPEDVFVPFHFLETMQLGKLGPDMGWKPSDPGFENFLQSESTWLVFWAQLDNPQQKQAYLDYLDAYALDQRKLGRFQRPLNNRVYDVEQWIRAMTSPMRGPSMAFLVLAILYLLVCVVNLVGLLMGKYLARMQDISVRRALGAPKSAIFQQHLMEVSLLGVFGGLVGLALSQLVLGLISIRYELAGELFSIDIYLFVSGLLISVTSGIIAGLLPAWRVCNAPPATYLNSN